MQFCYCAVASCSRPCTQNPGNATEPAIQNATQAKTYQKTITGTIPIEIDAKVSPVTVKSADILQCVLKKVDEKKVAQALLQTSNKENAQPIHQNVFEGYYYGETGKEQLTVVTKFKNPQFAVSIDYLGESDNGLLNSEPDNAANQYEDSICPSLSKEGAIKTAGKTLLACGFIEQGQQPFEVTAFGKQGNRDFYIIRYRETLNKIPLESIAHKTPEGIFLPSSGCSVWVSKEGIIRVSASLLQPDKTVKSNSPLLTLEQAVLALEKNADKTVAAPYLTFKEQVERLSAKGIVANPVFSKKVSSIELVYAKRMVQDDPTRLELFPCWQFADDSSWSSNAFFALIDATTGELVQ